MSGGPGPDRPHARADWRAMLVVGVIASALGIALGLWINWFPVGASKQAGHRFVGSLAVRLVRAGKWPVTVVP